MPGCGGAGASFGSAGACPGGFWRAGRRAGEAQLGEAAKDQPGPAAHLIRLAERGFVPAQGGLGEPVAVLDVEPVQVGAPDQVQVRHARAGPPQPQRPGDLSPVRQAFYGGADEMALDDGRPGEAGEPAAAGELGVQPAPGHYADLPVPLVVPGQFLVRVTPGGRVLAFEPVAAVLAGPARPAR